MRPMFRSVVIAASACILGATNVYAAPVYLNQSNITVSVGAGTTSTSSQNTFNGGQTINKVIDAPSAIAEEFHDQTTHIWFSGPVGTGLELLFNFGLQYDLSTLHFWNYTGEGFDVDNIDFTFFDASNAQVGALSVSPALGSSPGIRAQDIVLAAPLNVQFVTAFLSGTNGQIDFQNIGFTANLSTDRCTIDPNDPICNPGDTPVPEPSSILLVALGLLGFRFAKKRA